MPSTKNKNLIRDQPAICIKFLKGHIILFSCLAYETLSHGNKSYRELYMW